MLNKGKSAAEISEFTDLSEAEVLNLKAKSKI
jgi:hypothetical protein